jgi:anti-sigma regulatory factor (Ser/Thr protein kinase)
MTVTTIELPTSKAAPAMARQAVRDATAQAAPESVLDVLLLLTSEIVSNAVVHVHAPDDAGIRLSIDVTDERTRVEVGDRGDGFPATSERRKPGNSGGYGLALLDVASSRWGATTRDGHFWVWFEVDHGLRRTADSEWTTSASELEQGCPS